MKLRANAAVCAAFALVLTGAASLPVSAAHVGHCPHMEAPEQFFPPFIAFLKT